MRIRHGLFRVWVLTSVLFALAFGGYSYPSIQQEFREAARPSDYWDVIGKQVGAITLVPLDCYDARGNSAHDYDAREGRCWYELPKFRQLFPEYADLGDSELVERLHKRAGIPLQRPNPMRKIAQVVSVATGVPILVLLIGWAAGWAIAGFHEQKPADV